MTDNSVFPGFPPEPFTNFWPYPKAMNGYWHRLSGYEQKVLDYILRHTWGYKKLADAISLKQFRFGIVRRDGVVIDRGTGIKDERTVRKALECLEKGGFITKESVAGKETIFRLRINPSQEMSPLTSDDITPHPNDVRSYPSQNVLPTIKDISINNNNIVPQKKSNSQVSYREEINKAITYLSEKLGVKFPNYGKQAKYAKAILTTGSSVDDICWAIDKMLDDKWWSEHSFDMKNIADEIPKLMSRTYKKKGG